MPRRCVPHSQLSAGRSGGRYVGSRLVLLAALLAVGWSLGAPGVAAARRGDSDRATLLRQAQPLIDKGVAALAAKDFAAAAKLFGNAYRSAPVPEVLLQLARLAQAEGRTVDAYDLYRRYLSDPTRIPDEAAARAAETVLATAPPESGSLAIIGPPSALVLMDDRLVGVLPLPQPLVVAAGKHTLVLDLGGKRLSTPLQLLAGRLSEVRIGKSSGALLISLLPALLVLDEWPGMAADTLRPFTDAIERAVIGKQMGVMPAAIALREGAELKPCLATLPCQQQLAKRSSLDYLLRSRVVREAGPAPSSTNSSSSTTSPSSLGRKSADSALPPAGEGKSEGGRAAPLPQAASTTNTSTSTTNTGTSATSTGASATSSGASATSSGTKAPNTGTSATSAASLTANWSIELTLFHVEVSEPASTVAVPCPGCTADQAAARYRDALTDLLTRGLPRQFGTAQLTSEPAPAAVSLAERPLGKTPLHLALWEGSYELTFTHPGYQPTPQTLTITAGKETPLSVALSPIELPAVPAPPPEPPKPQPTARLPRPLWRMKLGGVVLGTSSVVFSLGLGFAALNDNPLFCYLGDPSMKPAVCQYVYNTTGAAIGTLSVGFALGVAGAIIMAVPGPRPN